MIGGGSRSWGRWLRAPALTITKNSPKPPPPILYRGLGGEFEGRARDPLRKTSPGPPLNHPRILLTGPPQSGKTTVVQKVVALWPGQAAGFFTREVRRAGRRLGFEIVTLAGDSALLSHVDFPGPHRVGKYGVNLENFHRVALPALEVGPGVDLIVVDEVGKMECLSARFVAALERLWAAPVPLLVTVAEKGGGYIAAIKEKPGKILLTVTTANRDDLPAHLLKLLGRAIPGTEPGS
jgi:nucleoside-triphosphatase